jgi:hypothetical protein
MADDEPVEVYLAESSHQAHFLRNILADAGILARVIGDMSTLGIRPGEESGPVLWVRRCDQEKARQILDDWDRSRAAKN